MAPDTLTELTEWNISGRLIWRTALQIIGTLRCTLYTQQTDHFIRLLPLTGWFSSPKNSVLRCSLSSNKFDHSLFVRLINIRDVGFSGRQAWIYGPIAVLLYMLL